jgi:hypothetical protein
MCILEFLDLWDERLKFLKSGKLVSAAEYISWHALVRIHLKPSNKLEGIEGRVSQADLELAEVCFHEIAKMHRNLKGCSSMLTINSRLIID